MLNIIETKLEHMPLVHELFVEYASTLNFDLCFQGFDEELASLPGKYAPPAGCVLLAFRDSKLAGCVALRPLENNISEMKRLYVRTPFHGQGIGRALATAIAKKAFHLGYKKMRLDTVPSMQAAINMYKSMGFYSIKPYRENPVPGTHYFEIELTN